MDDRVKTSVRRTASSSRLRTLRARLDPLTIKQLQRFLKDGDWQQDKDHVTVRLKDAKRCLYFKKGNGRWYMEHASKPKVSDASQKRRSDASAKRR